MDISFIVVGTRIKYPIQYSANEAIVLMESKIIPVQHFWYFWTWQYWERKLESEVKAYGWFSESKFRFLYSGWIVPWRNSSILVAGKIVPSVNGSVIIANCGVPPITIIGLETMGLCIGLMSGTLLFTAFITLAIGLQILFSHFEKKYVVKFLDQIFNPQ